MGKGDEKGCYTTTTKQLSTRSAHRLFSQTTKLKIREPTNQTAYDSCIAESETLSPKPSALDLLPLPQSPPRNAILYMSAPLPMAVRASQHIKCTHC
jgi:hypothetical protein